MQQFDIHDTALGKSVSMADKYDASLLFRIPRIENRVHYDINEAHLPFVGYDVWNCYELSFLTNNGLPISRVLKLVYPCNSTFLVESKSLKLYLNGFNMDYFGASIAEAEKNVIEIITRDLNNLLETKVLAILFNANSPESPAFSEFKGADLSEMVSLEEQETIVFSHFNESPELLRSVPTNTVHDYAFRSDLLRSNCRVTNQPDWGDLFVKITTEHQIDLTSIMEYLVSFRKENHFHEEVVEMIYKRFLDTFEPQKLMVAAMYTRRGGIDINPIRASHPELIDKALMSANRRVAKTMRQ